MERGDDVSEERILLDHGSGGLASHRLISEVFFRYMGNEHLYGMDDAACVWTGPLTAVSTDTFTVDPLFFPGGDIGSLAVHGTVNDVAMLGARPRYITCGFLIEEGLPLRDLERIAASMARAAQEADVRVVAGDTKVVTRGAADKLFINTTGLGELLLDTPLSGAGAEEGDAVLVSGNLGDHGLAVFAAREGLSFQTPVRSDSACLNHMVAHLLQQVPEVRVLRDPTRGGLATTLNEIAGQSGRDIFLREADLPVDPEVRESCSFLGLDPLYLANEGKLICVVPRRWADEAQQVLREHEAGVNVACIGEVGGWSRGRVILETGIGGRRLLQMLEGEQLPRIC
ncbi:MAG: hydrogenase expression/formation protein HypE [Desulfohalobiaceae bacterium]|nr:hydrogenase expression/formation protein HypE [Desulfohalobiaceae bacterium]